MKFAEWAPAELVVCYLNSLQSTEPKDKRSKEILSRLLTRPEMEKVWGWVSLQNLPLPLNANGGLMGRFFYALDQFDEVAKIPHSERERDFQEIHELTLRLYRKLGKYQNEHHAFNAYSFLIDAKYDEKLFSFLSPAIQEKIKARDARGGNFMRQVWGFVLPPIHEMMQTLSNAANNSDAKLNHFPKKIRQKSALVTYLINVFCGYRFFHKKCPHVIAATFLSVALDDPEITADTVRSVRNDETL